MTPFTRNGLVPVMLDYPIIARAKVLMRRGLDLHETALLLQVRSRDLDLSLWRHLGEDGWAEPAEGMRA